MFLVDSFFWIFSPVLITTKITLSFLWNSLFLQKNVMKTVTNKSSKIWFFPTLSSSLFQFHRKNPSYQCYLQVWHHRNSQQTAISFHMANLVIKEFSKRSIIDVANDLLVAALEFSFCLVQNLYDAVGSFYRLCNQTCWRRGQLERKCNFHACITTHWGRIGAALECFFASTVRERCSMLKRW